jgi:membrane protease YdiL (CAAX protease family)
MGRRLLFAGGPMVLLAAALVPALRPAGAVILALGWVVLRVAHRPAAIGWAAVLPLGIGLVWPWILGGDVPLGAAACTDPLSAIVVRRVLMAAVVLTAIVVLGLLHRSSRSEIGLRRPGAGEALLAAGGGVALVILGLAIGPTVARPFFGELDFPVQPAALVPAVLFGVANGVTEEVAYRGAMQSWLARTWPMWLAIGYQGLVFGIVHAGPEVLALGAVHSGLLAAVGVAAGVLRWRTGTLVIPIGIHIGADVALYVGLACRAVL